MKLKLKTLFKDSIWTISGLMLMNVVAQFIVYPAWNRQLGNDGYGNILYLLSLMNIIAISVGSASNYTRITESRNGRNSSSTYLLILLCCTALIAPATMIIKGISNISMSPTEWVLFGCLTALTMWRFYADVEYKLTLNYKGYFLYYLFISIGYGIGIYLSFVTNLWPLALIPGEIMGLIWVFLKGKSLRWDAPLSKPDVRAALKVFGTLVAADVISHMIFNGDRLLLKTLLDGEAVTMYYLASLISKTISLVTTPMNSIIIGYLVRMELKFTRKFMHGVSLISLALTLLATGACIIGSWILIPVLYPAEYDLVSGYFWIASLTQAFYFIGNMITVVLLRFCSSRYQLYINTAYAVAFLVFCPAATIFYGFNGFCAGLLATSILRWATALVLGYKNTTKSA